MIEIKKDNEKIKCEKCGGRLALVTGIFNYCPHAEPYQSGVREKSVATQGDDWLGAYKCDNCDHLQGFFTE